MQDVKVDRDKDIGGSDNEVQNGSQGKNNRYIGCRE